jgi:hypothetical protein
MLKNGLMEGMGLVGLGLNTKILAAHVMDNPSEQFFIFADRLVSQEPT